VGGVNKVRASALEHRAGPEWLVKSIAGWCVRRCLQASRCLFAFSTSAPDPKDESGSLFLPQALRSPRTEYGRLSPTARSHHTPEEPRSTLRSPLSMIGSSLGQGTVRTSSTPSTSFTSVRETAIQELTRRIVHAVDETTVGFSNDDDDNNDAKAHRFLSRAELAVILDPLSLQRLIRELVDRDGDTELDIPIDNYVGRTIGPPSRLALLALFLYEDRPELHKLFTDWLIHALPNFPSDDDMPLDRTILEQYEVSSTCQRFIFDDQNIFRPVIIQKNKHQTFRKRDRLPYIGKPKPIKDGSSGSVFNVTIAQGHWEIKSHDSSSYIPGNPHGPLLVAIKEFKKVQNGRSAEEATEDFEDERNILNLIRGSKIKHDMVMLDLGSITVQEGPLNKMVSHSLIFELATFSLAEFLRDERRARRYRTKNTLFAKVVDIVEALAYLHHHLTILHLDIKPDNILVFERGSSHQDIENEDGQELVWKLSDFGIARKKNARVRTGLGRRDSSYYESRSSDISATRPAGSYQAPEVQQRGSSGVGRRSDVWSMGCVTLMVLAFVTNGATEVETLRSKLFVEFQQRGGSQSLFYDRSDSYFWEGTRSSRYNYMRDFEPDIGDIPGTDGRLKAAVHPLVLAWSNVLHDFYTKAEEQTIVRDILKLIFCRVLLIKRVSRIKATNLAEKMLDLQERWRIFETGTQGDTQEDGDTESLGTAPESHRTRDSVCGPLEPIQPPHISVVPEEDMPEIPGTPVTLIGPVVEVAPAHSSLCLAIRRDNKGALQHELERDGAQLLKTRCISCQAYPIHTALHNNAYECLDIIVKRSDLAVVNLRCVGSGQTAIELASAGGGDSKALGIFLSRPDLFGVTKEFWNYCKKGLNHQSNLYLKQLWEKSQTQPARRSFFGIRR
jgi:serine/threonine protein kinase